MHTTMGSVLKLFRGLLALLDPTPGLLGSSAEDVDFLFPTDLASTRSHTCGYTIHLTVSS